MCKYFALVICCLFYFNFGATYNLNDEEYRRMPPILRLEPYEACMRGHHALYCTAYMVLVADEPNALFTQMQEYSKRTTSHFNRSRVLYGTCMTDTCKDYNRTDLRLSLEACQNETMYKEYGLKALVEDSVTCVGDEIEGFQIGAGHIVVAAVCVALVMCNVIGSLYDVFCSYKSGLVSQVFLCFSVSRNWQKLVAVPGERDPRQERLRGFYGVRAIGMTLVICAHSMLPSMLLSANKKFYEDNYDQLWLHIFLNGTLIMQTFLELSAILLVYNSLVISERHPITWNMLPLNIAKRWLRLTPAYGLVLGLTATWLQFIGAGPLWDKYVTIEIKACQVDWWKHLLYINNYFDHSHCMPQAWYLAADTQLYILGVIIFVVCKTPWSRKLVLSLLFLVGLAVPGLHTYFQDLDGALIVSPTAASGFFVHDSTFNHVYKRGHTNVACYAIGLACGYLIYHLQENNFDISKFRRWRPVYWAMFPCGCALMLLCKWNYSEGPRVSIIYRIVVACLLKPMFGLVTVVIVLGMIFKLENFYRGVLEWRGWAGAGRVSYSAYLLHGALIRGASGLHTAPIAGTSIRMIEITLFSVVMTYSAAFVFFITVESPLGELVKTLMKPRDLPEDKAGKDQSSTKL